MTTHWKRSRRAGSIANLDTNLYVAAKSLSTPRDKVEARFPTILDRCDEFGLNPLEHPIPVAPAAHYWMGGVATNLQSATDLPGLYAVGETACTGVHGANRLASNSLMECLVFAHRLAEIDLGPPPAAAPATGPAPIANGAPLAPPAPAAPAAGASASPLPSGAKNQSRKSRT